MLAAWPYYQVKVGLTGCIKVVCDRLLGDIVRRKNAGFNLFCNFRDANTFEILSDNIVVLSFTFCILFLALPWRRLVVTRDSCVCHLGSREMKLWKNLKEKNRKEKS